MIETVLSEQKKFFQSGATLSVRFRVEMLKKLYAEVKRRESEIERALAADLGKSSYESFMCEVGLVLTEIRYMIKHVKKFSKKYRVRTPLSQFASVSYTVSSPYGNVLIMSPWNYPFLLTVDPLADAIAAGNTAVVKPSAYSPCTSAVIEEMLTCIFPREYVAVVTGGRKENGELLDGAFDFVFFTGSKEVGKEVLRRCAPRLVPAVLELGGKSPCIVDSTAKIKLSAKRIVFGKFLNCGQTCVAPDYILCEESVKEELTREIVREIERQFGKEPLKNPEYGRIVNEKHFNRIQKLIDGRKVVTGGEWDAQTLKIAPTVMTGVTFDDAVMGEEIFGPVLPVLTFERFEELYALLSDMPKPLALYIFSEDSAHIREIQRRVQFGGGCVNDTVIHLATSAMPFGGVGDSGMGAYHGKRGFEAFSHEKSIVDKKTWMDLPMRYQPYKQKFNGLYSRLLRLFLR